jgi:L,D-transpeptidase catalytic domain
MLIKFAFIGNIALVLTSLLTLTNIPSAQSIEDNGGKNYLLMRNGTELNALGNPIYMLDIYVGGRIKESYKVVTGKADTQNGDRDKPAIKSPLPNGKYKISQNLEQGDDPEIGMVLGFNPKQPFIRITQNGFSTDRTDLGIHVDPSYNIDNGKDGTSGCIGLTNSADFAPLWQYITQHKIIELKVSIDPSRIQ